MDYRIYITVLDLPVSDEETWEPIIKHLESNTDFGPVISFDGTCATFTMSTDQYGSASEAFDACKLALSHALGAMPNPRTLTIDRIETEHADERELAAA
jgi:hypothetical protein